MKRWARFVAGPNAALFGAIAFLASTGASCVSTRACKQGTVMVTVTFQGGALAAKTLVVDATEPGQAPLHGMLNHTPGDTEGTIEITFASYRAGTTVSVTITAEDDNGAIAASATGMLDLSNGCSTMAITVGGGSDGGSDAGTGGRAGTAGQNGAGGHLGTGGSAGVGGNAGTGGGTGAGGNLGAGGTLGTGGRLGTGGGPPPAVCAGTAPSSATITDFSHATSTQAGINFPAGSVFTYNMDSTGGPGSSPTATLASGGLEITGTVTPGGNGGFGIHFNTCADVSSYTGVTFTLTGTRSNCSVSFDSSISVDDSHASNPSTGACTAAQCYSPSKQNIGLGAAQTIPFAALMGGMPQPAITSNDLSSVTGVNWNLQTVSAAAGNCTFDLILAGMAFVAAPATSVANFDADTQGFVFSNYDNPANLYVHNQGTEPTLTWVAQEGSPSSGALEVTAPFYAYNQYVDVNSTFGTANYQNWAGKVLVVRVKVDGAMGFNPDPSLPGGAQVYVQTGPNYVYASTFASISSMTSNWQEVAFDPSGIGASTMVPAGWDPTQVVRFGIEFNTGGYTATQPLPSPATFFVDSFWLE